MQRKSFTLVELIIVIAIIAVLAVISSMMITEWIGKSRDTRRLGDLSQIEKALDVAYVKNAEMPTPDSSVNVAASGTVIGYQGKFCDSAVSKTSIKNTPKDPQDDTCYSYYINADKNKYQLMTFLENNKNVIAYNPSGVYAADYSKRYPRVKGEKLGILVASGTNQPIEDGGAAVDVVNTTSNYIAYFSDSSKLSGTGGKIATLKNTSKNGYDSNLVGYWDMETNGTGLMLDLAGVYGNIGTLGGTITPSTIDGKSGKATSFDGSSSRITTSDSAAYDFGNKNFTISFWVYHTEAIGGNDGYVSYGLSQTSSMSWYFRRSTGGRLEIFLSSNGSAWDFSAQSTETVSSNAWHNIVIERDGNYIYAYLDGTKLTLSTSAYSASLSTAGDGLTIGAEKSGASTYTNFFGGYIDEVRIYNRAFSDNEIQTLYSSLK